MHLATLKTIAVIQIIGAAFLILSCVMEMYNIPETRNTLSLFLYALFIVYAGISIYYGTALWSRKPSAKLPCIVIWALQIPFLISKPLSYYVVLGIGFVIHANVTPNFTGIAFDFSIPEKHIFYISGRPEILSFGINFFAVLVAHRLLLYKPTVIKTPTGRG
ncbi:MAG: hypothetical protein RKR03_10070 [Candidatus Competibacter sp.]|nr:hypothetical protein [Candidatus Competibacter sp.]